MVQHLRLSQFVLVWGPGSILEGPNGPRIIPRPDIGLFNNLGNIYPDNFEISDQRMSRGLLRGNRIFRLPSNAELGFPHNKYLYRTKQFPHWNLCHTSSRHFYKNQAGFSVLFARRYCPLCNSRSNQHFESCNIEPVRFILACPEGHIDDIDWWSLVHISFKNCDALDWYMWKQNGSSLNDIQIECPKCGSFERFGFAYGKKWKCSGRLPEQESLGDAPNRPGCKSDSFIIQRQASNLRIPEIRVLFTIPPRHTRLHNLLQLATIHSAIVASQPNSLNDLQNMLNNLVNEGLISADAKYEIMQHNWDEIKKAIIDIRNTVPSNYADLLLEEFYAFINASVNGIPPVRSRNTTSPVLIEIDPNKVEYAKGPNGRNFKIVPVLRLRTVIVQIGYRREVDTHNPAKLVDVSFPDFRNPNRSWYPGVEFFGEGVFIMLADNDGWHFNLSKDASRWQSAVRVNYPEHVFRDKSKKEELNPVFVWWHTFSHLLIRAISEEAGYPAASIRERVYLEKRGDDVRGGILLYAAQPGSDGTLGGLVALVPKFQDILNRCIDMLENCSGDPLCFENNFQLGHYTGAACYACVFLSETSCEHRNMWLDRRILFYNLP